MIYTLAKDFSQLLLSKVCEMFLFRVTKFVAYFGLYESSFHFLRKEDQIDSGYGEKN